MTCIVFRYQGVYAYCEEWVTTTKFRATYHDKVPPIRRKEYWPTVVDDRHLLPPECWPQPGRRRKARRESQCSDKIKRECKKCKQLGHYAKRCRNVPAS